MKKTFKTAVILSDSHIDAKSADKSFKLVLNSLKTIRPDKLILNGDILDCGCISRHNTGKIRPVEGKRLLADIAKLNCYLKDIRPYVGEIIYIEGNHENWIEQAIDENPALLEGAIELTSAVKHVDKFVMNYNDHGKNYYKLGHLYITHGSYTGPGSTKRYLKEYGVNLVFGHTHAMRFESDTNLKGEELGVWNTGCLCESNPGYLRGKKPAWRSGFAIVNYFPNGNFQMNQISIVKNQFIYDGVLYK